MGVGCYDATIASLKRDLGVLYGDEEKEVRGLKVVLKKCTFCQKRKFLL